MCACVRVCVRACRCTDNGSSAKYPFPRPLDEASKNAICCDVAAASAAASVLCLLLVLVLVLVLVLLPLLLPVLLLLPLLLPVLLIQRLEIYP